MPATAIQSIPLDPLNDNMIACDPPVVDDGPAFVVPTDLGVGEGARSGIAPRQLTAVPELLRSSKLPDNRFHSMSALETAALLSLLCDPSIVRVVPYGHVLSYSYEGTRHRFIPGAVVVDRKQKIVVYAYLYSWDRSRPAWKLIERTICRAYKGLGVELNILTELCLFAKSRRDNHRAMLRDGVADNRQGDVGKVVTALHSLGFPATIDTVRRRSRIAGIDALDRTRRCLNLLALDGRVILDVDQPVSGATRITRGPVAWPTLE